jgi:Concanavalin A-like lectin/glucanases superfamily/Family of unknown function (DUF6519)/Kelch motif
MRGDLSRATFDAGRYSRVVAQQGRVQLDADWNEQQAIVDRRLRTALSDLFGQREPLGIAVAPHASPGFGIHVHGGCSFDGSGAGIVWDASPPSFGGADAYTIEAWLEPAAPEEAARAAGTVAGRFDGAPDPAGEFRVALDAHGGVVFERFEERAGRVPLLSRGRLRPGAFSFVACVFTGDAAEIWIDGKLDRRAAAGPGARNTTVPLRIAASGPAPHPQDVFAGTIEEVRVWRRRRLAHELRAEFAQRGGHGGNGTGEGETERPALRWTGDAATNLPRAQPRLCVSPGRCYVNGWLCENAVHAPLAGGAPATTATAYLDVWERYVSAYEEPAIGDIALGGLDTSGRMETVAEVRLTTGPGELEERCARARDRGEIAVEVAGLVQDNVLYRFEVHAPGAAAGGAAGAPETTVERVRGRDTALRVVGDAVPDWPSGQYLEFADPAVSTALVRVVSRDAPAPDGSRRTFSVDGLPDNVHQPVAVRPVAGVLWSKSNGSIVFPVKDRPAPGTGGTTTVVLRDEARRYDVLRPGQVVTVGEASPGEDAPPAFVSTVVHVATDVPDEVTLVLAGRLDSSAAPLVLRVWDGIVPADARPAAPGAGGRTPLPEAEVAVAFAAGGTYRAGDFWTARVRADTDDPLQQIDWPRDANGDAAFVPPAGPEHTFAELALVRWDDRGPHVERDLRRIVRSVAEVTVEPHREHHGHPPAREEPEQDEPEREQGPVERRPERAAPAEREQGPVEIDLGSPEHPHHAEPERREERAPIVERVIVETGGAGYALARSAPEGYAATGSVVEAVVEHPAWRPWSPAPEPGAAAAVTIDGAIYLLYERGTLWRRDPAHPDNPWEPCARYEGVRRDYAVAAAGGYLFVLGGIGRAGRPSRHVDRYDPRADAWSDMAPPMRVARTRFAAAGDARGIVACGGARRTWFGWWYASRTIEQFDVAANAWSPLEAMPFRRFAAAAVLAGSALYVIGGRIAGSVLARDSRATARVDRLHRVTQAWTGETPLHVPRAFPRAVAAGEDDIVVAGGAHEAAHADAERIRTRSGELRRLPSPRRGRFGLAALDGVVYALAGESGETDLHDALRCTLVDRIRVYRRGGEEE